MNTTKATLVYVRDGDKILLARKTRKVGAGLWNGYGGKLKDSQSFLENACDEFKKETGGATLTVKHLKLQALIKLFSHTNISLVPDFTILVYTIYNTHVNGVHSIRSTKEMVDPQWFDLENIPYDEMLPPDKEFLPRILEGEIFTASFRYGNAEMTLATEFDYKEITLQQLAALTA